MLAAVILAAGESSRMGFPKALIPFRGSTFLGHLLKVIAQASGAKAASAGDPSIGLVRVVLGAHSERITSVLSLDPSMVVINSEWQAGQLSSIRAAIRNLPSGEQSPDGIILFLVDHPLISCGLIEELAQEFHRSRRLIVLPTFQGKRGHPVIFSWRLFDELLTAPAETGARAVVWNHPDEVLEVSTEEEGVALNLNDPAALKRALDTGGSEN